MRIKGFLLLILIILLMSNAYAYSDIKEFCDESGNPVNDVKSIGWRCIPRDSDACTDVDLSKPVFKNSMPISTGTNDNYFSAEFSNPDNNNDYYIWYYYAEGYRVHMVPGPITYTYEDICTDSFWSTLTRKRQL